MCRGLLYIAIGIDLEGMKDVLGIWIGGNESAKYRLSVLTEIKNRGGRWLNDFVKLS